MTNEHVVTKEMIIKNKTIIFYYDNCDLKIKEIKLDPEERYI